MCFLLFVLVCLVRAGNEVQRVDVWASQYLWTHDGPLRRHPVLDELRRGTALLRGAGHTNGEREREEQRYVEGTDVRYATGLQPQRARSVHSAQWSRKKRKGQTGKKTLNGISRMVSSPCRVLAEVCGDSPLGANVCYSYPYFHSVGVGEAWQERVLSQFLFFTDNALSSTWPLRGSVNYRILMLSFDSSALWRNADERRPGSCTERKQGHSLPHRRGGSYVEARPDPDLESSEDNSV